ncbi:MAG: UvrD-helicase domain-containing protein, partial [Bacilli bacterium]
MIPIKPQNVIWSDEQWRAIFARGADVLVNAGAGSGKTAVLTERIAQILKSGVDINRLIVLTFTKA